MSVVYSVYDHALNHFTVYTNLLLITSKRKYSLVHKIKWLDWTQSTFVEKHGKTALWYQLKIRNFFAEVSSGFTQYYCFNKHWSSTWHSCLAQWQFTMQVLVLVMLVLEAGRRLYHSPKLSWSASVPTIHGILQRFLQQPPEVLLLHCHQQVTYTVVSRLVAKPAHENLTSKNSHALAIFFVLFNFVAEHVDRI